VADCKLITGSATTIGQIIQVASGQTANTLEIRNTSGIQVSSFGSTGILSLGINSGQANAGFPGVVISSDSGSDLLVTNIHVIFWRYKPEICDGLKRVWLSTSLSKYYWIPKSTSHATAGRYAWIRNNDSKRQTTNKHKLLQLILGRLSVDSHHNPQTSKNGKTAHQLILHT